MGMRARMRGWWFKALAAVLVLGLSLMAAQLSGYCGGTVSGQVEPLARPETDWLNPLVPAVLLAGSALTGLTIRLLPRLRNIREILKLPIPAGAGTPRKRWWLCLRT